ncbi:MAG TPA: PspC domain-containing protein [Bryobacteraceae bacterium]|jgi:phage shock protein C|nr:PspC domain-containing protein [Bryobacteraceae bacterium]
MYCSKCGSELRDEDRYCSQCGGRSASAPPLTAPRLLRLDKRNKKIAGVCGGFARYLDVDVVLVRVLWLGIALCSGGMGFLAYLAAWIVIPSESGFEGADLIARQPQTS